MKKDEFTVAVCIPTYNQAQYIVETLNSILNQDKKPDEVWICDDCSTDNTEEILKGFENKFHSLHYIKNKKNLGLSQNIYRLLRKPSTDYILMLHSDDIIYPNYISTLGNLLNQYPTAGIAHCNIQEIDEHSTPTKKRILNRNKVYEDAESALKESVKGYRVAANVIMFRKAALDTIDLPNDWPNFVEDYNIYTRLAVANWGNVFSSNVLGCYRVWLDQKGIRSHRKEAELNGYIRLFNETIEPAFKNKKWETSILKAQRKKLALLHSVYLREVKLNNIEQQKIINLLLKLDNSQEVNNRIKLHTKTYSIRGQLYLMKYKYLLSIKSIIKQSYFALTSK